MKKTLALFASDARPLYLDDIFRSLSLPEGYILKFRYNLEFISDCLMVNLKELIGQDIVIFFAQGNTINKPKEDRNIKNISIRNGEISDIIYEEKLELVSFFVKLKDFADYDIRITNENKAFLPPYKFVTEISVDEGKNTRWIDRVDAVKDFFEKALFMNLSEMLDSNYKKITPSISTNNQESFYELNEEKEYSMKLLCYDTSEGDYNYDVNCCSKYITVEKPYNTSVKSDKDVVKVSLSTHTIDIEKIMSNVKLLSISPKTTYETSLKIYVARESKKYLRLLCYSTLASLGLIITQIIVKIVSSSTDIISALKTYFVPIIISCLLIGFSSVKFYKFFNKK